MKKIFIGIVVLLSGFITLYTVLFWEPEATGDIVKLGDVIDISSEKEVDVMTEENYVEVSEENNNLIKVNIEDMTTDEYNELKKIITTLSTTDIGKIQDALKNESKENAIKKTVGILRTRLSGNNYEKIEKILSSYIDMNSFKEKL